ncbi:MAG: hypothetical protein NVSMB58_37720 [Terriglobales bacterium]
MVRLLDSDSDVRYIASRADPADRKQVLREYDAQRRELLRQYLGELIQDYKTLYQSVEQEALFDPKLAEHLVQLEHDFRRAVRSIRGRLLVESFVPRSVVRTVAEVFFSRLLADRLVNAMDTMHGRIA